MAQKKDNKTITVSNEIKRTFNYERGSGNERIGLNFTLRIDTKDQLKSFLELMLIATKDIQEEIDKA